MKTLPGFQISILSQLSPQEKASRVSTAIQNDLSRQEMHALLFVYLDGLLPVIPMVEYIKNKKQENIDTLISFVKNDQFDSLWPNLDLDDALLYIAQKHKNIFKKRLIQLQPGSVAKLIPKKKTLEVEPIIAGMRKYRSKYFNNIISKAGDPQKLLTSLKQQKLVQGFVDKAQKYHSDSTKNYFLEYFLGTMQETPEHILEKVKEEKDEFQYAIRHIVSSTKIGTILKEQFNVTDTKATLEKLVNEILQNKEAATFLLQKIQEEIKNNSPFYTKPYAESILKIAKVDEETRKNIIFELYKEKTRNRDYLNPAGLELIQKYEKGDTEAFIEQLKKRDRDLFEFLYQAGVNVDAVISSLDESEKKNLLMKMSNIDTESAVSKLLSQCIPRGSSNYDLKKRNVVNLIDVINGEEIKLVQKLNSKGWVSSDIILMLQESKGNVEYMKEDFAQNFRCLEQLLQSITLDHKSIVLENCKNFSSTDSFEWLAPFHEHLCKENNENDKVQGYLGPKIEIKNFEDVKESLQQYGITRKEREIDAVLPYKIIEVKIDAPEVIQSQQHPTKSGLRQLAQNYAWRKFFEAAKIKQIEETQDLETEKGDKGHVPYVALYTDNEGQEYHLNVSLINFMTTYEAIQKSLQSPQGFLDAQERQDLAREKWSAFSSMMQYAHMFFIYTRLLSVVDNYADDQLSDQQKENINQYPQKEEKVIENALQQFGQALRNQKKALDQDMPWPTIEFMPPDWHLSFYNNDYEVYST